MTNFYSKKIFLIFTAVSVVLTTVLLFWNLKGLIMPHRGTIIILNGPSVAGKSSLQKEFVRIMPELYLRLGVDGLFDAPLPSALTDMVSVDVGKANFKEYISQNLSADKISRATAVYEQRVNASKELIRAGILTSDKDGHPLLNLVIGSAGDRVIYGMHRSIAAYASIGNNVIVDYILYEPSWLNDLVNALDGYTVYFISIKIPLDILEEREKTRGTSPVGHARSHYDTVYNSGIYDLELKSAEFSAIELAEQLKHFVENNPKPQAFKKLAEL